VRLWYAVAYLVLCAALLVHNRRALPGLARDARDVMRGNADFEDAETTGER